MAAPVPNYTQGGNNIAGQFGMPLYGMGGIIPFGGNYFWVDESQGSDGFTGGPGDPFATLSQALSKCVDGNNDVIFLKGTVHVAATLTWSKSKTHLIGLTPNLLSQARARISQTGSVVFTPLVNVTATECIFRDIGSFHGFANASAQICWTDAAGRNEYTRCLFGGMGNATAAAQTGGRSLLLSGSTGESSFVDCQIGVDTVTRSAANASIEFSGGSPRNTFRNCVFPILTSAAGALFGTVGASGVDRFTRFQDCLFVNAIDSGSTQMTVGFAMNAAAGGSLIMQRSTIVGASKWGDTGGLANILVDGAPPTAATSGIAVNPT